MQRRLAGPCQRAHDYQIERGEGASARRSVRQNLFQREGLGDSLGGEAGVVEGVFGCGFALRAEEAVVASCFFGFGVVVAFGVAYEVDFSGLVG